MAFEFKFPDVGEGIHEGRIVEWLVKEGDTVKEDQAVMKVETDKAVVDLPAPVSGTVLKLHADVEDTIHVGDVIITIGEAGEDLSTQKDADVTASDAAERDSRQSNHEKAASSVAPKPVASSAAPVGPAVSPAHRPLATPHTRALARKLGVDLEKVTGSGKGGRITNEDVETAAARPHLMAPLPAEEEKRSPSGRPASSRTVTTGADEEERIPLTHLRKVIADAMSASVHTSAHVTHVDEADVTDLLALYRDLKKDFLEREEVKLTLMPFFIKAAIAALKDHPLFNAVYDEEKQEVVFKRYYHIGFAVDTDEGLIVPVIRNAHLKSIADLAAEVIDLAGRARERKLSLDEIQGGTFTITNIGPIGGLFATPIIHQPELAIVGTHTIQERPVVRDGEIVIRSMMYTSVSFDHRIIDGAEAARFMSDLVDLLSHPGRLLARI